MMSLSRGFRGDARTPLRTAALVGAAAPGPTPMFAFPPAGTAAPAGAAPVAFAAARGAGISRRRRSAVPRRQRPVPITLGPHASDRPEPPAGDRLGLRRAADRNLRQAIGRNLRQATELTPS